MQRFIIAPDQVYEAQAMDADCDLLFLAIIDDKQLSELAALAFELNLETVEEARDKQQLDRALSLNTRP